MGRRHVKTEAETGVIWPHTRECQKPVKGGRQERISWKNWEKLISDVLNHQICRYLLWRAYGINTAMPSSDEANDKINKQRNV